MPERKWVMPTSVCLDQRKSDWGISTWPMDSMPRPPSSWGLQNDTHPYITVVIPLGPDLPAPEDCRMIHTLIQLWQYQLAQTSQLLGIAEWYTHLYNCGNTSWPRPPSSWGLQNDTHTYITVVIPVSPDLPAPEDCRMMFTPLCNSVVIHTSLPRPPSSWGLQNDTHPYITVVIPLGPDLPAPEDYRVIHTSFYNSVVIHTTLTLHQTYHHCIHLSTLCGRKKGTVHTHACIHPHPPTLVHMHPYTITHTHTKPARTQNRIKQAD